MTRWTGRALLALALAAGCADDEPTGTMQNDWIDAPSGADVADAGTGDVGATDAAGDVGETDTAADTAGDTSGDAADTAGDAADAAHTTPDQALLLAIPESGAWSLPGLLDEVHVVLTEAGIPHVYAKSEHDLALVHGFVMARDRYFQMDLERRLGLGTVAGLLGDAALSQDQDSRGIATAYVADRIVAALTPELGAVFDAYAEGVNAYIDAVAAKALPLPSELELAGPLLGATDPSTLMKKWTRRDVAGVCATLVYQLGYETTDVGAAATAAKLPGLFQGAPFEELRRAGAIEDIWNRLAPAIPLSSAHGWGLETADGLIPGPAPLPPAPQATGAAKPVSDTMIQAVTARAERRNRRLRKDRAAGWGSNSWAVTGKASSDGASLLAGDGHLQLSVPSLFTQMGLDTSVFGDGDTHQMGLMLPGLPMMAVGTNGRVAWSQTQLMGDITDWYREELQLDADGVPVASRFKGEWRPLVRTDETYEIADVPLLGSVGRTETWARWTTFDGRWISQIEGTKAAPGTVPGPGETLITLQGDLWIPGDVDGDGVVTALSFDYTGLEAEGMLLGVWKFGHAEDVEELRQATRHLVGYSQSIVASDRNGDVLYTGYQAVPCRSYLPRDADGRWLPGADPTLILDGTEYGGFEVPRTAELAVDESKKDDPYACMVPFDATPQALSPAQGYVLTANNDVGGATLDDSLTNDPWYVGGPYSSGYRAGTIRDALQGAVDGGAADAAQMAAIQGSVRSRMGQEFGPVLIEAIEKAHAIEAAGGPTTPEEERIQALYAQDPSALDQVQQRLQAWLATGALALSGVQTAYHEPSPTEGTAAVATTIFNAWFGPFVSRVFDDEALPDVWRPWGRDKRAMTLKLLVEGRGADNPQGLASWNADTQESAFFDVLGTPEVETSREVALAAALDALTFLRTKPPAPGEGGFGTDDMSQWLWGLRHMVRFESLLKDFLGDDPSYALLVQQFSITTAQIPLADSLPAGDPRKGLAHFPRPGDHLSVDAANPSMDGQHYTYGSGPVFRMVIRLKGDEVGGQNILPGGQSGLTGSPHFHDQASLWLGNQTLPLRFHPTEVAAGATGREVYRPAP